MHGRMPPPVMKNPAEAGLFNGVAGE